MEQDKVSVSSKDDEHRVEMVWTTKIESLFEAWQDDCRSKAVTHNQRAKTKKAYHYLLSLPTIVLPLTMSTINQFFTEAQSEVINSVGYLITGSLSGINTFLNLPSQYQQHYDCEARYDELAVEIESILIKPKKDRVQADVQLESVKNRYEYLNKTAIDL